MLFVTPRSYVACNTNHLSYWIGETIVAFEEAVDESLTGMINIGSSFCDASHMLMSVIVQDYASSQAMERSIQTCSPRPPDHRPESDHRTGARTVISAGFHGLWRYS